ncbi:adenine/guanine phosphoribosyltransferase [Paenibacillus popilliae ATCC 14706]|uniref:Adenine/guanine phosphoribosyltransferase n=1 Tax=Paenibacillus popilliae ATCC 14706 TaxID=1212764 RepID=M9M1G2_PAEPP|nr:adenine/guanine phosphoribosyltransferase [Paenibacillus popilliae ATCC 14706]
MSPHFFIFISNQYPTNRNYYEKKKGTYKKTISKPRGVGWLSFSIKYLAAGGTRGYTETKYITSHFVSNINGRHENFKTVSTTESGAQWIVVNLVPGSKIPTHCYGGLYFSDAGGWFC